MSNLFRKASVFIRRKYRKTFHKWVSKKDINLLKDTNFVIVSDNCWGGSAYQWLKREYNTPFIGLLIYGDCYIKLLSNFNYYMGKEIYFTKKSIYLNSEAKYPIGKIGDIEIHFLHYKDENTAKTKWKKRTARMFEETNLNNYFFKMCDGSEANKDTFKQFHSLPFNNKISFSVQNYKNLNFKNHYHIKEKNKKNKIPNGVKLFKLTFLYLDVFQWIKNNSLNKAA